MEKEQKSLSDQIWDKVKGLDLNLFALPGQTLEKNADRVKVLETEVHLKPKTPAVIPALEDLLPGVRLSDGSKLELVQTAKNDLVVLRKAE